jgi:NDP-sugar pyrophosphorylase family protein
VGSTPKALVAVAGRPFIDHKLETLAALGFSEVLLSTGVGHSAIRQHVGDGHRFGVTVRYVYDGVHPLGTGGAVQSALRMLPDAFWVTYGDSLVHADVERAEELFGSARSVALMTVLHVPDRQDIANARVADDRVVAYSKSPRPPRAEHTDYGLLLLTRDAFVSPRSRIPFDLGEVLSPLAEGRQLSAFETRHPFRDIGDPDALRATEAFLSGKAPPRGQLRSG